MASDESVRSVETLISVEDFRKLVHEHFAQEIAAGNEFDANDIQRFDEVDDYVRMFIRHGQFQETFHSKRALHVFHDAMSWRKQNKVFEISPSEFPENYFQRGAIFYRNYDLKKNRLLHYVIRTFVKGQEDNEAVKRFIIYNFEEHIRTHPGELVVILFDMTDTGLRHLDYDLVKFIMHLLMHGYPGLLAHMLIYKLPFILQAAWRIIKGWLPVETQSAVKFVDQNTILQYIASDQLPKALGGTAPDPE